MEALKISEAGQVVPKSVNKESEKESTYCSNSLCMTALSSYCEEERIHFWH